MVLESLNSETPNIKDLSMEEQAHSELLFDPEKEIEPADWEAMVRNLEFRNLTDQNYYDLGAAMKLLFPDRFAEIRLPDDFHDQAIRYFDKIDSRYEMFTLAAAKILAPDQIKESDYNFRYDLLKDYITDNWKHLSCGRAMLFKILFPLKDITNELSPSCEDMIIKIRQNAIYYKDPNDPFTEKVMVKTAENMSSLKLLFSEKKISDSVTEDDWDKFRQSLKHFSETKNWVEFAKLAVAMKILAAKKAEITEKGIEIDMVDSQSFTAPTPPLPEQRSF